MISRFDHAVIAVPDLDAAINRYRALGFDVSLGGEHEGLGTHNAIVRFGLDYLELLAVHDHATAKAHPFGWGLMAFLRRRTGGLLGYSMATADIDIDAGRLRRHGLGAEGPFPMARRRPDGTQVSWRLLVPGGIPWRRPWPFLIQWDTPDEATAALEEPPDHPNRVTGVAAITVIVRDLEDGRRLHADIFGLEPEHHSGQPHQTQAGRAAFHVGDFEIKLVAPANHDPVRRELDEVGEGPFEVKLVSEDLGWSKQHLTRAGISVHTGWGDGSMLWIPTTAALGARLGLTGRRPRPRVANQLKA
ncbi:MAG: VOC family protein [Acidimicrobiia bacterium]